MTGAHGRRVGPEPPTRGFSTRMEDRRRAEEASEINIYAMVALVAALLGLFPVAIVFGLLALTRPGGRGMPTAAITLGVVEIVGAIAFLVLGTHGSVDPVPAAATTSVAAPVEPRIVTTTMAPLPPPPSAVPTTTDTPSTTSGDAADATTTTDGGSAAASGATTGVSANTRCDSSQNGLIGTGADGSTLVCTNIGENGSYRWSPAGPQASGVHTPGAACDPLSVGGLTGHTADGHAVACEGDGHTGSWTTG